MEKTRVLFICVHNSARSQMAEAFLNEFAGDRFAAESAGLEPGVLNPLVVKAMGEIGIDISMKPTRSAYDLLRQGKWFGWVITVCDESQAETLPDLPRRRAPRPLELSRPALHSAGGEEEIIGAGAPPCVTASLPKSGNGWRHNDHETE